MSWYLDLHNPPDALITQSFKLLAMLVSAGFCNDLHELGGSFSLLLLLWLLCLQCLQVQILESRLIIEALPVSYSLLY